MKKEWILSDEEKQQKRQKINENRAKKRSSSAQQPKDVANSQEDDPLTPRTPEYVAATMLLDLQPSTSGIERPQARVLPSSRGSGLEGPPEKVMRLKVESEQQGWNLERKLKM